MMTELIREQIFNCVVMAGAGIAVMFLYSLYKKVCRKILSNTCIQIAGEILFWIMAAAIFSYFLYFCAYGQLSFHAAAAFTAGVLLWKKFFYDIID